jgi:hypothetical protein
MIFQVMKLFTHNTKSISTAFAAAFILSCCIACLAPLLVQGYVMGSGAYRIDSDSVNAGGTSFSTSSSYSLGSSLGEIGTGTSSGSVYKMSAGFWQADDIYISLTSPTDANLGAISGLLGGTGDASSTWLVTTNNPAGYTLSVRAATSPALKAPNAGILDYVPAGADPDFAFTSPATTSQFGFTPEGGDIVSRFRDNGSVCNSGSSDTTDKCWTGFSTTSQSVASSPSSNHPYGAETTLKYRVKIGASTIQDSSPSYSASITVTAVTL